MVCRWYKFIDKPQKVQITWCRLKSGISTATIAEDSIQSNIISARKKAWQLSQTKYANYEHILYSSYLESQLEPVNRWRGVAPTEHIQTYPPLELLRKWNTIQNNEKTVKNSEVPKDVPSNWMEDYEFYVGDVEKSAGMNNSNHSGTVDPTVPSSKVPCNGCGAHLHCANSAFPGYIPSEIFKGRTVSELQTIICKRCHFLKHYNIALDLEVTPEFYVDTISSIKNKFSLAMVIVDLLDFPSSIWPGMQKVLGAKRPVFIIGNKVDLLPRDSNGYLENVKHCLRKQFIEHGGFDAMNIKHVGLISAKTGYGIEELINQLHKIWKHKGDVYLMGCTNVGKSTLFNILLNSDYCRPEATDLVRKATTCPWPGTTLQMLKFPILRPSEYRIFQRFQRLFNERPQRAAEEEMRRLRAIKTGSVKAAQLTGKVGRSFARHTESNDIFSMSTGTAPITTLNENRKEYREAKWCYDTPGVMHPEQITNLLTTEELLQLQSPYMIRPRAYRLKPQTSLLLAGLGRLDFVNILSSEMNLEWIKVVVFSSLKLPVVITSTDKADEVYNRYLGTELLGVPLPSEDQARLKRWPGLACNNEAIVLKGHQIIESEQQLDKEKPLICDITMSSAGWIGFAIPKNTECSFRVWTPHARGIFVRTPALIPLANRLIGKRIRNSLAYGMAKQFVFRK